MINMSEAKEEVKEDKPRDLHKVRPFCIEEMNELNMEYIIEDSRAFPGFAAFRRLKNNGSSKNSCFFFCVMWRLAESIILEQSSLMHRFHACIDPSIVLTGNTGHNCYFRGFQECYFAVDYYEDYRKLHYFLRNIKLTLNFLEEYQKQMDSKVNQLVI